MLSEQAPFYNRVMPHTPENREQRRRVRNAFIVFGICLAISAVIGIVLFRQYRRDLPATQDLVTGLIYFVESSGGRFPAGEDEFRAAAFVEQLPDGGFRIRPRSDSSYRRTTHGFVFHDLRPFEIAWGADLTLMALDNRGRVRDGSGNEVSLIRWPSSPHSGRIYSPLLLEVSRRARGVGAATATRPAAP